MFFRIELLLQSQRPEVEEMIRDMGVGQSAVEQLAVYCVSLKKYVLWTLSACQELEREILSMPLFPVLCKTD